MVGPSHSSSHRYPQDLVHLVLWHYCRLRDATRSHEEARDSFSLNYLQLAADINYYAERSSVRMPPLMPCGPVCSADLAPFLVSCVYSREILASSGADSESYFISYSPILLSHVHLVTLNQNRNG